MEIGFHLLSGDVCSQNRIDPTDSGFHGRCFHHLRVDIHRAVQHLAAAKHLHEFTDSVCRSLTKVGVDPLLVPAGRLCTHTEFLGGEPYAGSHKVGTLQHHRIGILLDLRVQPTHDTGHTYRLLGIIDHEHIFFQRPFLPIQCGELAACLGGIYDDLAAGKASDVVSMHRLPVFHHNEIGNVHHIVDRTHPCRHQSLLQPPGGLLDLDVFDDSGGKPSAQIRLDGDLDVIAGLFIGSGTLSVGILHSCPEGGRRLSRHAQHGQAVRAIRGDLKIDHTVLKFQCLRKVRAQLVRPVTRQQPDTVLGDIGGDFVIKAQFLRTAEHAVTVNAPQLPAVDFHATLYLRLSVERSGDPAPIHANGHIGPFVDVVCTGNQLQKLRLSDVYPANHQLVRIRVWLDLFDAAYLDTFDSCADLSTGFQVRTGHDHPVAELLDRHIYIDIIF